MLRKLINRRREGAALVEYGLIVAGVGLVTAASVAIFGHKTNDLIAAVATILPGAHEDDNGAIVSGKLIETTSAEDGNITVDTAAIAANGDTARLGNNVLGAATNGGTAGGANVLGTLVVEAN